MIIVRLFLVLLAFVFIGFAVKVGGDRASTDKPNGALEWILFFIAIGLLIISKDI